MEIKYLLTRYLDCYALLSTAEIKSGEGFMADLNGIYKTPEIDGFIGFLKVEACTQKKGNLPKINPSQIAVPIARESEECWAVNLELDDSGSLIVRDDYINLIGFKTS